MALWFVDHVVVYVGRRYMSRKQRPELAMVLVSGCGDYGPHFLLCTTNSCNAPLKYCNVPVHYEKTGT